MKKLLGAVIGAASVAVLFIAPAQSATVTISNVEPLADIGVPAASSTIGTVYQDVVGSVDGIRRSPWEGTALADTGTYTSVSGDAYATYVLDTAISAFTFMWGSVDTYNIIQLFDNGIAVDMVLGQEAIDAGAPEQIGFGIATIMSDFEFDEVRFLSGNNAFEYANVDFSAVPLPAALPLYGAGLAVMGFVGWRKRRKMAA
jgi:hypothetical protein